MGDDPSAGANGWRDRLRRALARTRQTLDTPVGELLRGRAGDEEAFEEVEEALIRADVGVETASLVLDRLRTEGRRGPSGDPTCAVREELLRVLEGASTGPAAASGPLRVVLIVGVNGTGKTTTAARLAWRWRREGRNVLLCAADTFRAAAIEQLEEWARRAEVPLVRHEAGGDPTAVLFDAIASARARGADTVVVDTAGRSHTRRDLMEELRKMARVAGREVQGAPHEVLLVLDATTGQNGLQQARGFAEVLPLTGLVLTKMDGTARGGIAVAASRDLHVPVRWVGVGEGLDDLGPFDAEAYVDGLVS